MVRVVSRILPSNGLATFRRNYKGDRLLPLSREDRDAMADFSGCIACGQCDAAFHAQGKQMNGAFRGPSDLPLSYGRSLPDYRALSAYLAELKQGDLEALERICPGRVPFRKLVVFAEAEIAALERIAAPALSAGLGTDRARR